MRLVTPEPGNKAWPCMTHWLLEAGAPATGEILKDSSSTATSVAVIMSRARGVWGLPRTKRN